MTAVNQDFSIYQGESKQVTFDVTDENGDNLDLTSYTAIEWIAYHPDSKVNQISKDLSSGIEVGGNTYEAVVTFDPSDTSGIDPYEYPHELRITAADGAESVVATGTMTLKYSKTK